ncbi:MAG: phosphoglycerate dehydrogenase, partial [Acidobacteria bacterium]|nr:phosphoglycerate dehydrogenase [Acidobacteriota bacterium]
GKLGTFLGSNGINIAHIHLARLEGRSDAVSALQLDALPTPEQVEELLRELPEVVEAKVVDLGDQI